MQAGPGREERGLWGRAAAKKTGKAWVLIPLKFNTHDFKFLSGHKL